MIVRLPLESMKNARELGGCVTIHKQIVKSHSLLRSDYFVPTVEEDIEYLLQYGVTSVLDLRSDQEREQTPSVFLNRDDITYYPISFMVDDIDNIITIETNAFSLSDFYIGLLQEKHIVKEIIQTIANAPKGCLLFHCAAGKDRTGVLAMLLLSLIDVTWCDIVNNYQVTYVNIREHVRTMDDEKNYPAHLMYSNPETIEKCMQYIIGTYGNTYAYLKSCRIEEPTIDRIKDRLL